MVLPQVTSSDKLHDIKGLLGQEEELADQIAAREEDPEEVPAEETPDENPEDSQSSDESLSEPKDESPQEGIETLNNLAEELDVSIKDMYSLGLKIPKSEAVPGGAVVTLGELKDFYTANVNIDQEREALKQKEQHLQTQSERVSEVPTISNELLQARAQVLAIQDAYNRTDWQGLRHTNQAEYAALQQDFRMQFETAKHQELTATQQFDDHKLESARIQQERLFEVLPELKDDKIRADTAVQVQTFASRYGITAKEIDDVTDHRIMRMLIEASRSESAKANGKKKQETKKAPVTNKPAQRKSLPGRKAALKRLTDTAREGDSRQKAAYISELIRGS